MVEVRQFEILGTHFVVPTPAEFNEALEIQWGVGLLGAELERARQMVKEHFSGLFLIEVEITPTDAEIDWSNVTQPIAGQDRSNWQVAYGETRVDRFASRWAFFFHCLDANRPISTPLGERRLPRPTPVPPHLAAIEYDIPG